MSPDQIIKGWPFFDAAASTFSIKRAGKRAEFLDGGRADVDFLVERQFVRFTADDLPDPELLRRILAGDLQ
jgi:hypothetical protein